MKRKNFAFFFLCAVAFTSYAGPGTYYNGIDTNQTCSSFKTILFHLLSSGTTIVPYGSVDNYYDVTDSKPAETGGGEVIDDRYSSDIPNGIDSCNFRYPADFCGGRSSTVQC